MTLKSIMLTVAAGVALTGCATTMDQMSSDMVRSTGSSAAVNPDGSYQVYQFSVPDNGRTLKATGGMPLHYSMHSMLEPLTSKERSYLAQVIFALAAHEGCLKKGYTSHMQTRTPLGQRMNPSQCDMITQFRNSANTRSTYLRTGRPDSNKARRVTNLINGARHKGWSDQASWDMFVNWGGYVVNGKTRTQLMQEFLQGTDGALNKPQGFF